MNHFNGDAPGMERTNYNSAIAVSRGDSSQPGKHMCMVVKKKFGNTVKCGFLFYNYKLFFFFK